MNNGNFSITGNLVDVWTKTIYPATIQVHNGHIHSIEPLPDSTTVEGYILPGFTDSHVHVESSMLVPSEFARLAVVHGTVATISDPHEIANVCGIEGVHYMIENGKQVPFKFYFGAPSCVPATIFETAGASIDSAAVHTLLEQPEIKYLSEMMNYPGVLYQDPEVMKKIASAQALGKPIDGHAPGLRGEQAKTYIDAGISTDHECFTLEEAAEKLSYGMKILIREGSAAKNFEALIPLLPQHAANMMFCSDDKHPDSLVENHLNALCARAIAKGCNLFDVLQAACVNPVLHYQLEVGLLRVGDAADFIVAHNLTDFSIKATYINGQLVAENGVSQIPSVPIDTINQFSCAQINEADLAISIANYPTQNEHIAVIEALEGQLITNKLWLPATIHNGQLVSNTATDVLKIVVVNRYHQAPVAKAFIKNFGFTNGAIASTVAHDSHNIVAVGVTDAQIAEAINLVIAKEGGISAVSNTSSAVLGLPVAGLMSNEEGYHVAKTYTAIDTMVKETLGSTLASPFMTLSFMALLVIPHLKLSDKGLFDGDGFALL